jgi:hypothetical protein
MPKGYLAFKQDLASDFAFSLLDISVCYSAVAAGTKLERAVRGCDWTRISCPPGTFHKHRLTVTHVYKADLGPFLGQAAQLAAVLRSRPTAVTLIGACTARSIPSQLAVV